MIVEPDLWLAPFRERRGGRPDRARRGGAAPLPLAAPHPRAGRRSRGGAEPGHAAAAARGGPRRAGHGPGHDRRAGLRRPGAHPAHARQGAPSARAAGGARASASASPSRSTAGIHAGTIAAAQAAGATSPWPARPSTTTRLDRGQPAPPAGRLRSRLRPYSPFSTWPPNSKRIADRTRSAKSASPREEKRSKRAAVRTCAGTDVSMAAWTVQRPSPESETRPLKLLQRRIGQQRVGGQVEQPRGDHAAAPPHLGHVGQVEVVPVELGVAQGARLGVDRPPLGARRRRGAGR